MRERKPRSPLDIGGKSIKYQTVMRMSLSSNKSLGIPRQEKKDSFLPYQAQPSERAFSYTEEELQVLFSLLKWKDASHNARPNDTETPFVVKDESRTFYTRDQIRDLIMFNNIICPEDKLIHDFLHEYSQEDLPLMIEDKIFGKIAQWRLKIGK